MPCRTRDPATLLAAARLYYLEGRSQAEIATQHGHQPVERLPDAHRGPEAGHRRDPDQRPGRPRSASSRTSWPAASGCARCGSRTPASSPGLRIEDQVGTQAARLLLDNLKDSMTVALSWGHALQSMVYATTSDQEFHRLTLVQLVGGLSSISNEISGQELVRELAVRLGAGVPLPARAGHPRVRRVPRRAARRAVDRRRPRRGRPRRPRLRRASARPPHGSSSAILDSLNLTDDGAQGVLGRRARSATSPPATTTPTGHADPRRRRRPDPRRHPRGPGRASPTWSGWRTAAPRSPASSAPCAGTSSTPWSATRPSPAACSARPRRDRGRQPEVPDMTRSYFFLLARRRRRLDRPAVLDLPAVDGLQRRRARRCARSAR